VDGKRILCRQPFLVIATQNPSNITAPTRFPNRSSIASDAHQNGLPLARNRTRILRAAPLIIQSKPSSRSPTSAKSWHAGIRHPCEVDASLHDYALEIVNRTRNSDQLALA